MAEGRFRLLRLLTKAADHIVNAVRRVTDAQGRHGRLHIPEALFIVQSGADGLVDRRGKAKPESKLTEEDRLRMENKILQAKLKDKEMEIALLKKLKELEGGGW